MLGRVYCERWSQGRSGCEPGRPAQARLSTNRPKPPSGEQVTPTLYLFPFLTACSVFEFDRRHGFETPLMEPRSAYPSHQSPPRSESEQPAWISRFRWPSEKVASLDVKFTDLIYSLCLKLFSTWTSRILDARVYSVELMIETTS